MLGECDLWWFSHSHCRRQCGGKELEVFLLLLDLGKMQLKASLMQHQTLRRLKGKRGFCGRQKELFMWPSSSFDLAQKKCT